MNADILDASIKRGLQFLQESQLPSGEWKSYRSRDKTMATGCEFDSSPFPSAMIAYSLGFADVLVMNEEMREVAEEMLKKVTCFFLAEMEDNGVWRYWTKAHPHHAAIPPDLDDMAYISAVLQRRGVSFPSNTHLIALNRNPQGLFYTWLAPRLALPPRSLNYCKIVYKQCLRPLHLYAFWKLNESEPSDVDGVVNANVLFYLGESSATRPVIDYLMNVVHQEKEECCDKWHLNRFTFYYALSRNFHAGITALGAVRDEVISRIASRAGGGGMIGRNALDTGLAASALLNWNSNSFVLDGAIEFLLSDQRDEGSWPRDALYYGGPEQYYGWGSEELTTGFCLEALMRYRCTIPPQQISF